MDSMLRNCYSLTTINLSGFSTTQVISMSGMFENCGKLESLNLSHFITNKTNDMSFMFNNCTSLKFLKLGFNTEKVKDMQFMFSTCIELTSLDISSFDTNACQNYENMFLNDTELNVVIDSSISPDLRKNIPDYVNVTDIKKIFK